MGVFGPDGLSERNLSYTGKPITSPLKPTEQTTIQRLVKSAPSYDFVLHPGTFTNKAKCLAMSLIHMHPPFAQKVILRTLVMSFNFKHLLPLHLVTMVIQILG